MATQCATRRASVAPHHVKEPAANGRQPLGGSILPASASLQRVDTPLGPFDAIWSAAGLWAFAFARPEQSLTAGDRMQSKLQQACDRYFQTGHFDWDLEWLDWSGVSAFHRRVLRACHLIPTGSVLTYGELAARSAVRCRPERWVVPWPAIAGR